MKHLLLYFGLTFIFALSTISCSEDPLGSSIIDTSTPHMNDLDQWIREVYTSPYNMEVKYRWEDIESDESKNLVPPEVEKVQPLLQVMKNVWLSCYDSVAGVDFLRLYVPKLIYLVGSPGVNPGGTVTQGTAEAGRKITLYEVNKFDPKDAARINRFFHVMHHEFAHILHQTKNYPISFGDISGSDYRADWFNVKLSEALAQGCVSPYALSEKNEDFVETIAVMLTHTREEWEAFVTQEGANTAKLKLKETYVADWFLNAWKIDIYELQALIAKSIEEEVNS